MVKSCCTSKRVCNPRRSLEGRPRCFVICEQQLQLPVTLCKCPLALGNVPCHGHTDLRPCSFLLLLFGDEPFACLCSLRQLFYFSIFSLLSDFFLMILLNKFIKENIYTKNIYAHLLRYMYTWPFPGSKYENLMFLRRTEWLGRGRLRS